MQRRWVPARIVLTSVCLAAALTGATAGAAGFPSKPITLIVQSSAGGGSDSFVRTLAAIVETERLLPQPIVVDNKPGGSGAIAYAYAVFRQFRGVVALAELPVEVRRVLEDAMHRYSQTEGYKRYVAENSLSEAWMVGPTTGAGWSANRLVPTTSSAEWVCSRNDGCVRGDLQGAVENNKAGAMSPRPVFSFVVVRVARPIHRVSGELLQDTFEPGPNPLDGGADLDASRALLALRQTSPCACYRVPFLVEQLPDLENHHDVALPVEPLPAAAFARLERGEFALPITEHVRRHTRDRRDFADPEVEAVRHLGRRLGERVDHPLPGGLAGRDVLRTPRSRHGAAARLVLVLKVFGGDFLAVDRLMQGFARLEL